MFVRLSLMAPGSTAPAHRPAAPRPDPVTVVRASALARELRRSQDDWRDPGLLRLLWIDRAAVRLSGLRDRLSVPLARTARVFVKDRLWTVFGCARAEDHCRERYGGRTARWLRDLAALGRGLVELPGLAAALAGADGGKPLGRHGAIHGRSGQRCVAPLCTGRACLHGHHVHYLSHGGGDEPENLVTLCAFHHLRGEHGLLASCRGRAPLGLLWRLGREDVAEWYMNERRIARPT